MAGGDQPDPNWAQSARVIQGGGQQAALDLTAWRQRFTPLTDSDEQTTGITREHFPTFVAVARSEGVVIIVRQTKAACLRWIRLDYPAKPPELNKIKNSKQTGLVTCAPGHPKFSYDEQLKQAYDNGFYVLVSASDARDLSLKVTPKAKRQQGGAGQKAAEDDLWARRGDEILVESGRGPVVFRQSFDYRPGMVIEPSPPYLPITGDYDLMGVFPVTNPQGWNLVKLIDHEEMEGGRTSEQSRLRGRFGPNVLYDRENPRVNRIIELLNAYFPCGRSRIMHGPHELKFDPADKNEEGCAVFWPGEPFWIPTAQDVEAFYQEIGRLAALPFQAGRKVREVPS